MPAEYSIEVCNELEARFRQAQLHRRMRVTRYDPGQELVYHVSSVSGSGQGRVRLSVEKFVGGGFAGQVYQVKVLEIEADSSRRLVSAKRRAVAGRREPERDAGVIEGIEVGQVYAMKILVPPSRFARLFRSALYWVGLQGPFQLQVNPAAARAGALWLKFIRRAAKIRFGDENTVVDVYATFVDETLGSCGELSEWVDGRTWRLEVDERLDLLRLWRRGKPVDQSAAGGLGSPEYRAKRDFMRGFVELLHDMGAYEFARQYEWSTGKSQPNCLKRRGTEDDPSGGLVAVDFRAGLALLPFLPMSPGDFKLILKGILRGSLVQFDRGSITRLETFVQAHPDDFSDMRQMLQELKAVEQIYRDSVADITHNHIRLFYSRRLWSTILDSAVTSWKIRNFVDRHHEQKLRAGIASTLLFSAIGVMPFLGRFVRRLWARPDWCRHYRQMLMSWDYLRRALRGRIAEKVIVWHRSGRVSAERAPKIAAEAWRFWGHLPFSILPARLHHFFTDRRYAKQRLAYLIVRPVRLYFNAALREQWLREMVTEGRGKHILSGDDARIILSQVDEPFIQKYLKSLAVHLCTLPVTQVVSVIVAYVYVQMHPELTWQQATVAAGAILVAFQLTPISPGSLVRGLYVLYLVIRERNFKDYNIAAFLGFFKYVGYLAFPIQMAYHYPALARFMAAHWATEAVHIVPVFGERGALLEHGVFYLFYNWPLTIRRRMRRRAEIRASMKPRYWHVGVCAVVAAAILGFVDFVYMHYTAELPRLRDIWWFAVLVPLACGSVVTLSCGGAALGRRIVSAAVCGAVLGGLYAMISLILAHGSGIGPDNIVASCAWPIFVFAIWATIGAVVTELRLPEPDSS